MNEPHYIRYTLEIIRGRQDMENKVKPNGTATFTVAGKTAELPVYSGTHGPDVVDIASLNKLTGHFTLDPGFTSTASCESQITFIDGGKGTSASPWLSDRSIS